MRQEISKKTMKALEKIAMEKSSVLEERGGIERRWSNELDFPEIDAHRGVQPRQKRCEGGQVTWQRTSSER